MEEPSESQPGPLYIYWRGRERRWNHLTALEQKILLTEEKESRNVVLRLTEEATN